MLCRGCDTRGRSVGLYDTRGRSVGVGDTRRHSLGVVTLGGAL